MRSLTVGLAGLLTALVGTAASVPAQAEEFYQETQPMFENCADGSLDRVRKEGIVLGEFGDRAALDPRSQHQGGERHRRRDQQRRPRLARRRKAHHRVDALGIADPFAALQAHRRDRPEHPRQPRAGQGDQLHRPGLVVRPGRPGREGQSRRHQVLRRLQGQDRGRDLGFGGRELSAPDRRQYPAVQVRGRGAAKPGSGPGQVRGRGRRDLRRVRERESEREDRRALEHRDARRHHLRRRLRQRPLRHPQGGLPAAGRVHGRAGRAARERLRELGPQEVRALATATSSGSSSIPERATPRG